MDWSKNVKMTNNHENALVSVEQSWIFMSFPTSRPRLGNLASITPEFCASIVSRVAPASISHLRAPASSQFRKSRDCDHSRYLPARIPRIDVRRLGLVEDAMCRRAADRRGPERYALREGRTVRRRIRGLQDVGVVPRGRNASAAGRPRHCRPGVPGGRERLFGLRALD